jgi:3-phenylpropionate/trans-cinnamate dioxygenase ferredoxin reductase subunit
LDDGVVIVGGGLAAQRCAETLRRGEYPGRLRIVCAEPHRPYDRPPLSKELLRVEGEAESPAFRPEQWYQERDIELLLATSATALDPDAHRLELADGSAVSYEHLVIATGARPRTLPLFDGYTNVSTLRTLEDSRLLRRLLTQGSRLAIIGAGFIGQEVAAAARAAGVDVAVIELESLPLVGLLGPELGRWFAELHSAEGVDLILGEVVSSISGGERIESLTLSDDRSVACDHVLIGVGVTSDVGWLESAGLPATGVPTDASGRSELPDVFAAGDAAAAYDPFLAQHVVSGHWEAASRQGIQVADRATADVREGTFASRPTLSSLDGRVPAPIRRAVRRRLGVSLAPTLAVHEPDRDRRTGLCGGQHQIVGPVADHDSDVLQAKDLWRDVLAVAVGRAGRRIDHGNQRHEGAASVR